MFTNNPLLVYLDDTYKVTVEALRALVAQADGFLLRGVKNVYDYNVRPGVPTLNSDAWRAETDGQSTDLSYFTLYDAIRTIDKTKPIYMVVEGNPALDRSDYKRSDSIGLGQLNSVRRVVQTTRYVPDAFLVKIVDFQWWEAGKIATCTPQNFATCYDFFLQVLYNKYRKETEVWSNAHWIKTNRPAFIDTMDTWNNPAFGGPKYPAAFSFYHSSVPNGRTLADLKQMLVELAEPDIVIVDPNSPYNGQTQKIAYLTAGTYSGFDLPTYNSFGLWGFDGNNFFAGVTDAAKGTAKGLEVFTHRLFTPDWKEYIGFAPEQPPEDTLPPSTPAGLTAIFDGTAIQLAWVGSIDDVGVAGYRVYEGNVFQGETAKPSFTDGVFVRGATYVYQVIAFDMAGNESAASTPAIITVPVDPGEDPTLTEIHQLVTKINVDVAEIKLLLNAIFRNPGESDG